MYCLFMGCTQRGVQTTADRCPECGRPTSTSPPPAAALADDGRRESLAATPRRNSWRAQTGQRLAEDAKRVSDVFAILAWVVVIGGALTAFGVLVAGLNGEEPAAGLLGAVATVVSTIATWALMMLGSVVTRYVSLQSSGVGQPPS